MINTKKILLIVVGVVLLLVVGIIATDGESKETESSRTSPAFSEIENVSNNKAPDFTLFDTNGDSVSLSDYEGKVVILNFWATWCGPCRMEIPEFVKLQEKYGDDVVILGISVDQDGPKVVPSFMKRFEINYPVLYATNEIIYNYGGITGVPTTFVLDRNLIIQRLYIGYRPVYVFEQDIKALI